MTPEKPLHTPAWWRKKQHSSPPERISGTRFRMKKRLPWALSRIKSLTILLLFVFGIRFLIITDSRDNTQECISFRDHELRGRIDTVFMDYNRNAKGCRINFSNGTTYLNPLFFPNISSLFKKNDSMYKPSGRFAFLKLENGQWKEMINADTLLCNK